MGNQYDDYEEEYCDICYDDCHHEIKPHKPQKPKEKPSKALLKCGTPGAVTLPLATIAGTTFNVATVTVDTRKFCSPCIKFEFASNVQTTAAVLTLNFQIFKQCKNQLVPVPIGPIWTFQRLVAVTSSDTFSFAVCDCDVCDGECCTYSVVATVAGVATVGVTTVSNATLIALVVENSCGC